MSDAQTDADGQTRARAKGGAAPSSSYSVALLASLSSFSFHSLRLSQLTHSHIQVMSLADAQADSARTDYAAGRVVTDPLINW